MIGPGVCLLRRGFSFTTPGGFGITFCSYCLVIEV
nr:MAG TPA: Melanin biosynthesis protein [Caudoviricetes sp.]